MDCDGVHREGGVTLLLENAVGKSVSHSVRPIGRHGESQECGRANIKKMLGMHEWDEGGARAADGCVGVERGRGVLAPPAEERQR